MAQSLRFYITVKKEDASSKLRQAYSRFLKLQHEQDDEAKEALLAELVPRAIFVDHEWDAIHEDVELSTTLYVFVPRRELPSLPAVEGDILVVLKFKDPAIAALLQSRAFKLAGTLVVDLPIACANHWCPNTTQPVFGRRSQANWLIRAGALGKLTGAVNVVMVDEGLDAGALGGNYAGGWQRIDIPEQPVPLAPPPGTTKGGHGAMTARNVCKLAPGVRLYDMPLIPKDKPDLKHFLSDAHSAFFWMRLEIAALAEFFGGDYADPWVICNAWAVYGTQDDTLIPHYRDDMTHPLNIEVGMMVASGHDTVFAAGNCGTFFPDLRCGRTDRGPGRSILGANSHPNVVSVAAVRTDGDWLGYSSEGPGLLPAGPDAAKPDIAAPASFHEDDDSATGNGGTSAACAVTAGVIAAVRSDPTLAKLPPATMLNALRETARPQPGQPDFGRRIGRGVLDVGGLMNRLKSLPSP